MNDFRSIFPEYLYLDFPEFVFWDGILTAISQKNTLLPVLHNRFKKFLENTFSKNKPGVPMTLNYKII